MTIQRQYSLPNCTLVLEGVGEEAATLDSRPLLNVLVNAECRFVGQEQPLAGGSEFFENLVAAVSRYSQEVLSGIPSPAHRHAESSLVELQAGGDRYHRLIVRNGNSPNGNGNSDGMTEVRLSSVQLFDLVEAIDQALADNQTLPHLSLQLQPVSRRRAKSGEPITQRALPAALGLSSLAVAAIAFFFIPNPEVRRVEEEPAAQSNVESIPGETDSAAADNPPDNDVTDGEATDADASADAAGLDEASASDFETVLEQANPLTDEAQVSQLNQDLRARIVDALDTDNLDVEEDLEYRVALSEDGNIVGYRYLSDSALNAVDQTPLPDLRRSDQSEPIDPDQLISQHRVVITPRGVVEVSPWYATSPSPAADEVDETETSEADTDTTGDTNSTEQPVAEGAEITDTATLETLTGDLYDLIREDYERQEFPSELMYRVTFDQDGQVLAISPENDAAESADDGPLAQLEEDLNPRSQSPRTDFMVVFTEDGILQVSPWNGY
ncbi:MAG: DUF4335 domain-containing protein [Thainema sp.]